jgi:hypothetical protein
METRVQDEPKAFERQGTESDVQRRIGAVMAEACAELNDELKKYDIEIVMQQQDPHVSTRIADFRFMHANAEVGFFRAIAFVPVGSNDLKGNTRLTGFSVLLQLAIDPVRENITLNENSLLETLEERMAFKQEIMAIVRAALKKGAV